MIALAASLLSACLLAVYPRPGWSSDASPPAPPSAAPTAAPTAADIERARGYFDAGRQAYDRGQFATSISAFEEALHLAPGPSIVFSLAQAWRRQAVVDREAASLRRSVDLYRRYIGEVEQGGRRADAVQHLTDLEPVLLRLEASAAPAAAPASQAPELTQLMVTSQTPGARAGLDAAALAEMPLVATVEPGRHRVRVEAAGHFPVETDAVAVEGRLVVVPVALREAPARLALTAVPGAVLQVDGRAVGEAPLPAPVEFPAGDHNIAVGLNGHELDVRTLRFTAGEVAQIQVELNTTVQRRVSYGLFIGSGALLAAAGTFAGLSLSSQADANNLLARRDDEGRNLTTSEADRYDDARNHRDQWRGVSLGTAIGGAALGLLATGLYFFDAPGPGPARPLASPSPAGPGPGPTEEF